MCHLSKLNDLLAISEFCGGMEIIIFSVPFLSSSQPTNNLYH